MYLLTFFSVGNSAPVLLHKLMFCEVYEHFMAFCEVIYCIETWLVEGKLCIGCRVAAD